MKTLVFLDTETTGIDETDRLFEVAYKYDGHMHQSYFRPPVPISIKASSITHITDKDVEDKEEFYYSAMKGELNALLKESILVAHNAFFDVAILEKEGVEIPNYICTLKVARAIDKRGEFPEYNLQYLRYFLNLQVEKVYAHDAKSDVLVLEKLFEWEFKKMMEEFGNEETVINKMIEITNSPVLFLHFPFGKHKGKLISEVAVQDREYVLWLLDQKTMNPGFSNDEDWIHTLNHYLKL